MTDVFEINAQARADTGSAASRRLRRSGMVPAVLYGGREVLLLAVKANELGHQLENEAFYSHILKLKLNGTEERVILRALQRHPSHSRILHVDFLRISEDQAIRVSVPLHFIGEDACVGVKQQGGVVSHLQMEVEISCLPKDLPEFIEMDISQLELGQSFHLSDVKLPQGVEIVALTHGEVSDNAVVSVHAPRVVEEALEDGEVKEEAADEEDGKKEGETPKADEGKTG